MTSVIASARVSTASVFDVVTTSAKAIDQLVGTGAKAIDMLDAKTRLMHQRVTINAAAQLHTLKQEEIMRAAESHAHYMYDLSKRMSTDKDLENLFNLALTDIRAAVDAA